MDETDGIQGRLEQLLPKDLQIKCVHHGIQLHTILLALDKTC